MTNDKFFEDRI